MNLGGKKERKKAPLFYGRKGSSPHGIERGQVEGGKKVHRRSPQKETLTKYIPTSRSQPDLFSSKGGGHLGWGATEEFRGRTKVVLL